MQHAMVDVINGIQKKSERKGRNLENTKKVSQNRGNNNENNNKCQYH